MIEWMDEIDIELDGSCEGIFTCRYFRNLDGDFEMPIVIPMPVYAGYAERCVEAVNSLPDRDLKKICRIFRKYAKRYARESGCKMPALKTIYDILGYCNFETMYITPPADGTGISYFLTGIVEWGDDIGFVVKNNRLEYVGNDPFSHADCDF